MTDHDDAVGLDPGEVDFVARALALLYHERAGQPHPNALVNGAPYFHGFNAEAMVALLASRRYRKERAISASGPSSSPGSPSPHAEA
jgi:hypothetical protein